MMRIRLLSFGGTLSRLPRRLVPVLLVLGMTLSAEAQTADPIVTSDTVEYCGVLIDRITGLSRASVMPPPLSVAELSQEGERMCVHGQTRGGIMRLRRALAIMRHGED
jgi:hypothetical protein